MHEIYLEMKLGFNTTQIPEFISEATLHIREVAAMYTS